MTVKRLHAFVMLVMTSFGVACEREYVKQDLGLELDFVDITFGEESTLQDPRERYELDYEFQIMQYEVTQEQFELVLGYRCQRDKESVFLDIGDAAAYFVSWNMAANFANEWSSYQGLERCYVCTGFATSAICAPRSDIDVEDCEGYRLPTEMEWELAARSGTKRDFWTGAGDWVGGNYDSNDCDGESRIMDAVENPLLSDISWYCGNNEDDGPKEVGLLMPNGFGIYDIHGNVWEWMHSGDGFPYSEGNPHAPGHTERILRGGGFHNNPYDLTLTFRSSYAPTKRLSGYGFRLARSLK